MANITRGRKRQAPSSPRVWPPLLLASLLIGLVGCNNLPTQPTKPSLLPIKGVTLVDWTRNGYLRGSAEAALNSIVAVGANRVVVLVTAYQSNSAANEIRLDRLRTPTVASVKHALAISASLGLETVVKPHVDVDDGSWRGQISPSDPAAWFESYRAFLLPLAALADSVGAVQFVVGTELASTLQYEDHWLETIRQARTVFSGELIYGASWDETSKVPFWNALDFVGVDFYSPVSTRNNPGRLEILANWQPWLERMRQLHEQTDRQIILTEIGYRSIDGAGRHPYEFLDPGRLDLQEQADLYWAALEATRDLPWLTGIYWWNWPADGSGGPANRDFSPANKPAESELMQSWRLVP